MGDVDASHRIARLGHLAACESGNDTLRRDILPIVCSASTIVVEVKENSRYFTCGYCIFVRVFRRIMK